MPEAPASDLALPVAVIGSGPVGLAAAAHLIGRGLRTIVLEAGPRPGGAIRAWGHVRMFSPWRFNLDGAARRLLEAQGWQAPEAEAYPTGADLLEGYVEPLAAALRTTGADMRFGARVIGVARRHHDRLHEGSRLAGRGRDTMPFVLHVQTAGGAIEAIQARAVIDCSGTWACPNPAGAHGLPAPGEAANADRIAYGIPDVRGAAATTYGGATTMVLGGGHSAMNAVLDLVALARQAVGTRIVWAFRRPLAEVNFGGGAADGLGARGALGTQARSLVGTGLIEALAPFLVHRIERDRDGLLVLGDRAGEAHAVRVNRVIVATGFRPDLSFLGEVRLGLDVAVQSTPALAPLIDPNLHSCGTVRPHGEAELRHADEPGFYIAGMKAYGRAPTFLLATGHEQVRSIAAYLAGDVAAARRVELILPETGVCSTQRPARDAEAAPASGCCGPSRAPEPATACCAPSAAAPRLNAAPSVHAEGSPLLTDVTIYHNPACGTSRNTLGLILNSGTEPRIVEYLRTPPSRDELAALIRRMGVPVRAVLREKGTPYAALGLDDPGLTDDQLLDAMMAHPILINRPIVVTPLGARLCRPSEEVLPLLPDPQRAAFAKEDGEQVVDDRGQRVSRHAP